MINLNFTFLLVISSKGLFFVSFIFSFLLSLDGIFLLVKWIFVLLGQTYMFLFFFLGCDLYVALLFPWVRLICPLFFLGWDIYVAFLFPWVRLICDNKLFRQETFPAFSTMFRELYCIPNRGPFRNFTTVNSEVLNRDFANINKIFYLNWGGHFSSWFNRIFWRLRIVLIARSKKLSLDLNPQKIIHNN